MPSAAYSTGPVDPHGLGAAVARLGMFSKRAGKVAFAVVSQLLDEGERVEILVQGRYLGEPGALVLTDRRLVVANDHEWKVDTLAMEISPSTTVQGWQDERTAALVIADGDTTITMDQISERETAHQLAAAVRARAGTG